MTINKCQHSVHAPPRAVSKGESRLCTYLYIVIYKEGIHCTIQGYMCNKGQAEVNVSIKRSLFFLCKSLD